MEIELEIIHFKIHLTRTDLKKVNWLRFDTDLLSHPDFFMITGDEFRVYFHVMCVAGKVAKPCVRLSVEHAAHACHCTAETVLKTIDRFESKRWKILAKHESVQTRNESVPTEHNSTSRNGTGRDKTNKTLRTRQSSKSTKAQKELNAKIWESYRSAYLTRYHYDPVRNAKVNTNISQIAARLGPDAIEIVKFFVFHNDSYYLKTVHNIGGCLKDAEGLATQWKRNQPVTNHDVKKFEKAQNQMEIEKAIKEGTI